MNFFKKLFGKKQVSKPQAASVPTMGATPVKSHEHVCSCQRMGIGGTSGSTSSASHARQHTAPATYSSSPSSCTEVSCAGCRSLSSSRVSLLPPLLLSSMSVEITS